MKEEGTEGIWDQFKNNKVKPYKGGITIDHIKKAVDYVFDNLEIPKQERYLKLKAYCRGKEGLRDYGVNMEGLCNHKECNQCRSFEKEYQKEITRQLNNLKDENNNKESN